MLYHTCGRFWKISWEARSRSPALVSRVSSLKGYLHISLNCDSNARHFSVCSWPPTSCLLEKSHRTGAATSVQQQAIESCLPVVASGRNPPQVVNLISWSDLWPSLSRLLTVLRDPTTEAIVPGWPLSYSYLHNVKMCGRREPGKLLLGSSRVCRKDSHG